MTHTPGPWNASPTYGGRWWVNFGGSSETTSECDARLIAAAPDMLEALKALHACHRAFSSNDNWTVLDDEARAAAEAAIAKAEGTEL